MLCVECGKEEENLHEGLCIICYLKKTRFFFPPEYITVTFCKNCDNYRIGKAWMQGNLKENLQEHVRQSMNSDIITECVLNPDLNEISTKGTYNLNEVHENYPFSIIKRMKLCPKCSLQKGGYYEAIIQVRGDISGLLKKIDVIVEEFVNKEKDAFITKKEEVKGGIDYYISHKTLAEKVSRELKNTFGAKLTVSSSLVGMKDGERLYRITYSLRISDIIGDIYKIDDELYTVISVGKKIKLKGTDGTIITRYDNELKRSIKINADARMATVLYHDDTTIYFLDESDFNTKKVARPKNWEEKHKINIVEYQGKIYLFD